MRLLLPLLLAGCSVTPYIEGGVDYASESGEYWSNPVTQLDEEGWYGTAEVGFEFEERWYLPSECYLLRHRSHISRKPELSLNSHGCTKRLRFGRATLD